MYRLFKTMKKTSNVANNENEDLYRILKLMKRASEPSIEEMNENENCLDPDCYKPKRGQEKLYQMFKTMKRSYGDDDLYRSLKTMKNPNDLYRSLKTMKKFNIYPFQAFVHSIYGDMAKFLPPSNDVTQFKNTPHPLSTPKKKSNDLYRAFKTMKRSDNLYRTLKTLK